MRRVFLFAELVEDVELEDFEQEVEEVENEEADEQEHQVHQQKGGDFGRQDVKRSEGHQFRVGSYAGSQRRSED